MKGISIFLLSASAALYSSMASASPIDITYYNKQTSAGFDFMDDSTLDSSNPETSSQTSGDISNETTVEHTFSSTMDLFSFDMTHSLATESSFDSVLTTIMMEFTALNDATYSLAGIYSMLASEQILMVSRAYLFDSTTAQDLFLKSAESTNTSNESLILQNANDGDFSNVFEGSPTGNLFAGHQYWFEFTYGLYSLGPIDSSNANGEATFNIQAPAEVPEPGSLALAFLAVAGIWLGKKGSRIERADAV